MTTAGIVASCSFCLKPNTEVTTLVAGPGVFICDGCVSLSGALIAAKPAGVPRVSPWETEFDLDQIMANLPRIAAAKHQVEQNLAGWVRRARELGATWTAVGDALGMARQSAWERFSGEQNDADGRGVDSADRQAASSTFRRARRSGGRRTRR